VAPERRLPAAATGLSATAEGDHIVLRWTNPTTRVDGTPLRDLTEVTVHRREEAGDAPPRPAMVADGGVVGYDAVARIALATPAPAEVDQGRVRVEDRRGLAAGRRYVYVVTAKDAQGRMGPPSERLVVTLLAAPRPPERLAASPGDGRVTLNWSAPTQFTDGSPVTGEVRYVVFRASGDAALAQITPEPVTATTFTDTGLTNEVGYRYAVRGVRVDSRGTALGDLSTPVEVSPVDTTPPEPPRDLVALPFEGAITLAWRPSSSTDVSLYAIYRATAGGEFLRVGAALPTSSAYTDREVQEGTVYRYAVSALDRARRPNESARSNVVTVTGR
jgi:fibronectin type 3 domain-containing protein